LAIVYGSFSDNFTVVWFLFFKSMVFVFWMLCCCNPSAALLAGCQQP